MTTAKPTTENTGMMLVITFAALFVVNSLVLLLANNFFPQWVVLGTMTFTTAWAVIHSMGKLALINTFAIPFIHWYENKQGKKFHQKNGWLPIF